MSVTRHKKGSLQICVDEVSRASLDLKPPVLRILNKIMERYASIQKKESPMRLESTSSRPLLILHPLMNHEFHF